MVYFHLRKTFRGNLNEAISLAEIVVILKATSIQPIKLLHLDFYGKFSLREN